MTTIFSSWTKKGCFSILVKKSLLEKIERLFAEKRIPLTYIGNSTLEILYRLRRAKPAPDFFIESDDSSCTLVFQKQRLAHLHPQVQERLQRPTRPRKSARPCISSATITAASRAVTGSSTSATRARPTAMRAEAGRRRTFPACDTGLGGAPYIPGCR